MTKPSIYQDFLPQRASHRDACSLFIVSQAGVESRLPDTIKRRPEIVLCDSGGTRELIERIGRLIEATDCK